MMDCLLSADAGLAIFVHGNEADVFSINDHDTETTYPVSSISYLLADATDIKSIKTSKDKAIDLLRKEHSQNRALTFTLILLDAEEDEDTVDLAVDCLEELFADKNVFEYVENVLFSNTIPTNCDLARAIKYASKIPSMAAVFKKISASAELISRYRMGWSQLSEEMFDNVYTKSTYEERLVALGVFKRLVRCGADHSRFSLEYINCLNDFKGFSNSRNIITHWLSGLAPNKAKLQAAHEKIVTEKVSTTYKAVKPKVKGREAFLNVVKQKNAIYPILKQGDWKKARKYVDDLINTQMRNSEPEHAAKSLCDLAQHAKLVHNHSLQLELAKKAVEICSSDGWTHCQVADAYICLSQYDNAIKSLELAQIFGRDEFAQNGYARILRGQRKYTEAIAAFKKCKETFPDSPITYNAYADILREVWRIDEALAVYDEAIDKFYDDSSCYCGKATTLKTVGRLDEALELYQFAHHSLSSDSYSGAGVAEIFKLKGDYDKALDAYNEVISKFPDESLLKCGRATIFRLQKNFTLALKEFRSIAKEFPYDESPKEGEAETLKDLGKLDEALQMYNEVIERFPDNNRARNGRANVFKAMGEYERSLQTYDENVRLFPYDIVSWNGRADLLKQLGRLDDAVAAYQQISEFNPLDKRAQYSQAAILVALERYTQALGLLPDSPPQSADDWFAHHIRGMIYMKSGAINNAITLFEDALVTVPFFNIQKQFKSALAVASLRLNKSLNYVDKSLHDPVRDVINIHAYGKMGNLKDAKEAYIRIEKECPPFIITLRDELAARYIKQFTIPKYDLDWIFKEECNVLLLDAA